MAPNTRRAKLRCGAEFSRWHSGAGSYDLREQDCRGKVMADYDVIVIGAGPGGYVCAIRCAQLG